MASTRPITVPPSNVRTGPTPVSENIWEQSTTSRKWVIFVAIFEILGSLVGIGVYTFALMFYPDWYPYLVPIPDEICNAVDVVRGVMFMILLLCVLDVLMGWHLLHAAKNNLLGRLNFWLICMLTYFVLVLVVIFGIYMAGLRCVTMNAAAMIHMAIRFAEMLPVYIHAERMYMARKLRQTGHYCGQDHSLEGSTLTICTDICGPEDGEQTRYICACADPPQASDYSCSSSGSVSSTLYQESATNASTVTLASFRGATIVPEPQQQCSIGLEKSVTDKI